MPRSAQDLKAENDLDAAMREEGFTDGTTPPVDATPKGEPGAPSGATEGAVRPAAPVPAPAVAPAVPAKKGVRVKTDHAEEDIDETWFTDAEKAKRLKENYEKGYGHDRVVARTREEARNARDAEIVADLRQRGYRLVPNPQNPNVLDIFPPSAAQQVAMPAAAEVDPLAKEEAELMPKVKDGDPEAVLRVAEIRVERRLLAKEKAQQAEQQKQLAAQQAQRQKAEHAQTQQSAAQYVQNVIATAIAHPAHAKSFEGDSGAKWKQLAELSADQVARTPGKTEADVAAAVAAVAAMRADAEKSGVASWQASAQRGDSPPVLSGVPAGNGKRSLDSKSFDINNDEDMKAAWEEAAR